MLLLLFISLQLFVNIKADSYSLYSLARCPKSRSRCCFLLLSLVEEPFWDYSGRSGRRTSWSGPPDRIVGQLLGFQTTTTVYFWGVITSLGWWSFISTWARCARWMDAGNYSNLRALGQGLRGISANRRWNVQFVSTWYTYIQVDDHWTGIWNVMSSSERTKPVQNGRIATTSRTNLSIYQRRLKFDISGRWLSSVEPPKDKGSQPGSNFLRDRIRGLSHGRAPECVHKSSQTNNQYASFFRTFE